MYSACSTSCWTRSRSASGAARTSTTTLTPRSRTGSKQDARPDQAMLLEPLGQQPHQLLVRRQLLQRQQAVRRVDARENVHADRPAVIVRRAAERARHLGRGGERQALEVVRR